MPTATTTATLVTRETIVELRNHPPVPSGDADHGQGEDFTPTYLVISTDYEGRPARLISVTVTATGLQREQRGRWSSVTRHPVFRLDAIPEALRTLVLAYEPDLAAWVNP